MSPAESPKSVLAPIWAPITVMSTDGGALCGGADGLRARGARYDRDLTQRLGFLPDEPDGPGVRRGSGVRPQHLDLAPGGTPSGRRDPKVCLGIGIPSKTALNDVELERGED
jgi:hypothetical protein